MPDFFQKESNKSKLEPTLCNAVLYTLRINQCRLAYEVRRRELLISAIHEPGSHKLSKLIYIDLPAIIQKIFPTQKIAYSSKKLDPKRTEVFLSVQGPNIYTWSTFFTDCMISEFENVIIRPLGTLPIVTTPPAANQVFRRN